MKNPEIQKLRDRIDEQDEILFKALRQRAGFARKIGEIKRQQSQVAHVPERERQVLEKFLSRSDELLSRSAITSIFREIMSACLRLEEPLRVAALGPLANTFSSRAARRAFGSSAILVPEPTLALVIEAVEAGRAHHAVESCKVRAQNCGTFLRKN
jgi:chorismate mutase / prephenate dehydratase